MNERIKELANQAGFNPYNYEGANAELFKKFAELIVKECFKLNSKELSITAIERLLPLYEEHFGVKL
jgi:hypothetical protein